MAQILVSELTDGDVLLHQGTAFISRMIRHLDGGPYSHAAIFHAGHITEALGSGITINNIGVSIAEAKYVDVYRFLKAGKKLGAPDYPVAPLTAAIQTFENNRQRYAYEQILLLALLCSTRKLTSAVHMPGLAMVIRNVLESAGDVLDHLTAAGKEPVICSELVYRCYFNANAGGKYKLTIMGADIPGLMALEAAAQAFDPRITEELRELQAEAIAFLSQYAVARQAVGGIPEGLETQALVAAAVADFVTPRDLMRSPDLQLAGTLVIDQTALLTLRALVAS
jgi:hypothetical protein